MTAKLLTELLKKSPVDPAAVVPIAAIAIVSAVRSSGDRLPERILAPIQVWVFTTSNSSGVSFRGARRM